jgi:hypothetical protein
MRRSAVCFGPLYTKSFLHASKRGDWELWKHRTTISDHEDPCALQLSAFHCNRVKGWSCKATATSTYNVLVYSNHYRSVLGLVSIVYLCFPEHKVTGTCSHCICLAVAMPLRTTPRQGNKRSAMPDTSTRKRNGAINRPVCTKSKGRFELLKYSWTGTRPGTRREFWNTDTPKGS